MCLCLYVLQIHKRLCNVNFANLQKIVFHDFKDCELAATWSASYTLKMATLIIANFNFTSEAKRKNQTNAIFTEFTVYMAEFITLIFMSRVVQYPKPGKYISSSVSCVCF